MERNGMEKLIIFIKQHTVLTKTSQCSGFVLSSQHEDYHQEKVNRMGRRCFCTLY